MQPPPSPRELLSGLPSAWETAVLGCLQIDPASRFQNATDVIAVLEGLDRVLLSRTPLEGANQASPLRRCETGSLNCKPRPSSLAICRVGDWRHAP